jgi:hypothetical protein
MQNKTRVGCGGLARGRLVRATMSGVAVFALASITVGAQEFPPVSGAANAVTSCIMSGVDTSICIDSTIAGVVPAPTAGHPIRSNPPDDIDKDGGHEVERS